MILEICIPTFRRELLLCELLKHVPAEIVQGGEVIVSIHNNTVAGYHSTELLTELERLGISIHNHKENLGFSRNVESLILASRGDYLLLCGDDDHIDVSALLRCVQEIQKEKSDLPWVIMDTLLEDEYGSRRVHFKQFSSRAFVRIPLFVQILIAGFSTTGFIGSHLIPARWARRNVIRNQYGPNDWVHQFLFVDHLIAGGALRGWGSSPVRIVNSNSASRMKSERYVRLYLQRCNFLLSRARRLTVVPLVFLVRELISPSIYKEILRLIVLYPRTARHRLFLARSPKDTFGGVFTPIDSYFKAFITILSPLVIMTRKLIR